MSFPSLLHLNIVYSYYLLLNNQQIKVTALLESAKGVIINKQINIILFDLLQIFIITVVTQITVVFIKQTNKYYFI